ncbi:hypothetical protein AB5I41_16285 [Sphingomonas sp. MMS24-JH45]
MPPGKWSSQRHWHEGEDEIVVVLAGRGCWSTTPDGIRCGWRRRDLREGRRQRAPSRQRERCAAGAVRAQPARARAGALSRHRHDADDRGRDGAGMIVRSPAARTSRSPIPPPARSRSSPA